MPADVDHRCPFCGSRFRTGATACPSCDLPLLGADGSHPPERRRTPFDGAALFADDPEAGDDTALERRQQLATERRGGEPMRCVVVAINAAEADMLSDMLRAQGVACLVRSLGLHSYAQHSERCEILVPESSLTEARELLRLEEPAVAVHGPSPHAFAAIVVIGLLAVAAVIALLVALAY
jgi:hypothetical protein